MSMNATTCARQLAPVTPFVMRGEPRLRRWHMGIAVAIFTVSWFATLASYRLFEPDEGRYAEIPREMIVSGDWVTPRLNDIKYFEKPPLQYWATATAYALLGASEWTARLWVALTGFLGIVLTGWLGRRLYGWYVGLLAAAVQVGSMLYAAFGHISTLDMGLCFVLQLTLTGLVLLVHERDADRQRHNASLVLAVGIALAFLSKGLIGIVIPSAAAVIFMVFSGDWQLFVRARVWWTLVALIVLAAPWVFTVSQRNPEFLHFFFVHEHFERFLSRVHGRYQPAWFFVPILLIGFMPWTPMLPKVAADCWHSWRAGDRVTILLVSWIAFIFTFFSLSQSKLIPYILPIFPALALLSARTLATLDARKVARYMWQASTVWLCVAAVGMTLYTNDGLKERVGTASLGLMWAFFLAGITIAAAAALATRRPLSQAVCVTALSTIVLTSVALLGAQQLPGMGAAGTIARKVQSHLDARTALYCVDDYLQSLPFYLNRACKMVGYRGEMDFGLQQEPARWIPDLAQFAVRWRAESDAAAIVRRDSYDKLSAMKVPMRVIFKSAELVVIARK